MGGVPFVDFYEKRVRRILPAWLFVLVVSLQLAVVFAVVKTAKRAVVCGGGGVHPNTNHEPHPHHLSGGLYAPGEHGGCW